MIDSQKVHELQRSIQELRSVNDDKTASKSQDPLWDIKMAKINSAIDAIQNELELAQKNAMQRNIESKSFNLRNVERKQVLNYLKKGIQMPSSSPEEQGAKLQIASMKGSEAYNATYSLADSIYEYLQKYSTMRNLCSTILVSKDTLDMPISKEEISSAWTDGTTISTPAESMVMNSIKTFELTAQPKVTQKMIDDASIDLEAWLVEKLAGLFLLKEDEAFLNGDGVKSPKGILTYPEPKAGTVGIKRINSGNASSFNEDGLLRLYYSLPEYYNVNASFIMNKATVQTIRTLKDATSGQYYWMPGILFGKTDTLLGAPLYTTGYMPTVAAGKDVILFGDMKRSYQIVDRSEITIQRDPYSSKPFVIFYATKRVGGDIINPNALNILKVSA